MENNNAAVVTEAELSYSRCKDGVRYKGIRHRKWGKWGAEIRLCGSKTKIWLGSYDTPQQAAMAYDAALFCLRGPNSRFNFSESCNNISSSFSSSSLKSSAVFSSSMLTAHDIKSFSKKYALQQARAMAQAEPPGSSSSSLEYDRNKISVFNSHEEQQEVSVDRAGAVAFPELWKIQENVARFGCELQLANFMQQHFNHNNNTIEDDDQAEIQLEHSMSVEGIWSG